MALIRDLAVICAPWGGGIMFFSKSIYWASCDKCNILKALLVMETLIYSGENPIILERLGCKPHITNSRDGVVQTWIHQSY
jgi:hypothetical protein